MTRTSCLLSIFAVAAGCTGNQFTSADENSAGAAGEAGQGGSGGEGGTAGKGGTTGKGGSSSGTSGSDAGGSDVGGNGNGGSGKGGVSGSSSGGSSTGGDAGDAGSGPSGAGPGGSGPGGNGPAGSGPGGAGPAGTGPGGTGPAGSGPGGTGPGGRGGTGGTGGAGSGGKGGIGGAVQTPCPQNPPASDTACSTSDYCTYGTHPLYRCRDVYDCVMLHWQRTEQPNCPAVSDCNDSTTPPVNGAMCANEGDECLGAQGSYCMCAPNCTGTVCTVPPIWQCFGPPLGCPATLPNHGQPCTGNLTCLYGTCGTQTAVNAVCENGFWRWRAPVCPQ